MRSQIVLQMPRPVALGIGEHGDRGGGLAVTIPAVEQENRQCLALQLFPQDRGDFANSISKAFPEPGLVAMLPRPASVIAFTASSAVIPT